MKEEIAGTGRFSLHSLFNSFMQESRTAKSLKNAEVSVIYYAWNLNVGFWASKK